jgi:hypothetical protein
MMHDYLQSASDPQRWAVFGRGSHWGVNVNKKIQTEGKVFTLVAFSNKEPRAGYFAHGRVEWIYNDRAQIMSFGSADGSWTQMLRHDDRRYYKVGTAILPTYREVDEQGNYVGTDEPWHATYYPFNPLYMPIAAYGYYAAGMINRPQIERAYLEQSKLFRADDQSPAGLLKGAWIWGDDSPTSSRNLGVVTFAEKQNWRPVNCTLIAVPPGSDTLELLQTGQPTSRISTDWQEAVLDEGDRAKKFFVPVNIRIESDVNGVSLGEQAFYFQWKLGDDATSAFPKVDDRDWREPIRRLFDEDFARIFDPEIDAPGEDRGAAARRQK